MNPLKEQLINEQSSPVFRIMSVYDDADPARRKFDGNITAFHIGNGYVLSVAHYLRMRLPLLRSTPDNFFQGEILPKFSAGEANQVSRHFPLDASNQKRYLTLSDEKAARNLIKKFSERKCDTRVEHLYSHGVCKPF